MAIGADVCGLPVDASTNPLRVVPDESNYADELLEVFRPGAGVAVVVLLGEHDLATRDALDELFRRLVAGTDLVVVDLSQVKFIDGSTLGALARADQAARTKGGRLRLQIPGDGIVRRMLEITNLLRLLDCSPSREAALSWPSLTILRPAVNAPPAA